MKQITQLVCGIMAISLVHVTGWAGDEATLPTGQDLTQTSKIHRAQNVTGVKHTSTNASPERSERPDVFQLDMPAVLANIKGTGGTRLIKVRPHLVLSDETTLDLLKTKWRDRLQATVVTVFADTTMEDLLGKSGILRAASNVVAAVNTSIEGKASGRVLDVFFSEYLIQ